VRGGLDDLTGVGDVRDRLLVFQAVQFNKDGRPIRTPSDSDPAKQLQLINGQLEPTIGIRPNETQRWRILNASSDKFLVLRVQGHSMFILADDGNPPLRAVHPEIPAEHAILGVEGARAYIVSDGRSSTGFRSAVDWDAENAPALIDAAREHGYTVRFEE